MAYLSDSGIKQLCLTNLLNERHDVYSEKRAPAPPFLRPQTWIPDVNIRCRMEMVGEWREIFGWERWGEEGGCLCNHTQFASPNVFRASRDSLEVVTNDDGATEKECLRAKPSRGV